MVDEIDDGSWRCRCNTLIRIAVDSNIERNVPKARVTGNGTQKTKLVSECGLVIRVYVIHYL